MDAAAGQGEPDQRPIVRYYKIPRAWKAERTARAALAP
jgi:hypothetical protein